MSDGIIDALGLLALAVLFAYLSVRAATAAAKGLGIPAPIASGAVSLAAHYFA